MSADPVSVKQRRHGDMTRHRDHRPEVSVILIQSLISIGSDIGTHIE